MTIRDLGEHNSLCKVTGVGVRQNECRLGQEERGAVKVDSCVEIKEWNWLPSGRRGFQERKDLDEFAG